MRRFACVTCLSVLCEPLIGTLSGVLGFNLGGGNWPCRGVVKIGW